MIILTYMPSRAKSKLALEELYCLISSQMDAYPEGAVIVAGDVISCLKAVLDKFHNPRPETTIFWTRSTATSQGHTRL